MNNEQPEQPSPQQPPVTEPQDSQNQPRSSKKNMIFAIVGVVAAALLIVGTIFYFVLASKSPNLQPESNPPAAEGPVTENTPPSDQGSDSTDKAKTPKTYTISYTNSCFDPASLAIKVGDTVTFVNNSSRNLWPASNDHPSHTTYAQFDPKKSFAPGQSWSFTFTKAGNWGYHDHLKDVCDGVITVE